MHNANKTVLITGTSSGIGLEAALYFFEHKWNVIATMRNPASRCTPLHEKGLPDLVHLDVMDGLSIRAAIQYALDRYQKIDVLVNNAGYAVYGPFEATTQAQITRQFNTNVFGLMEVAREFLPLFRKQKGGVLVNVASMGGRIGFPLYTVYNSTKWAVEGFSEALQYELKPLNIRVKLIEPGVIKTDFYDRSLDTADSTTLMEAYGGILKRGEKCAGEAAMRNATLPRVVARTIYRAATDGSWRLRYPVGGDAWQVTLFRRLLPERLFYWLFEKAVLD
ncbi:MAG: SDR family oxidoreductase [Anaerolineae bacterium]|nr:SDR family oxidoreductase [Anaerolineae bacterium]